MPLPIETGSDAVEVKRYYKRPRSGSAGKPEIYLRGNSLNGYKISVSLNLIIRRLYRNPIKEKSHL